MKRMGHTGREMVQSGEWCKVASKHYRHASGVEIRYNCNRWLWEVSTGEAYTTLWVARYTAERNAFAAMPVAVAVQ